MCHKQLYKMPEWNDLPARIVQLCIAIVAKSLDTLNQYLHNNLLQSTDVWYCKSFLTWLNTFESSAWGGHWEIGKLFYDLYSSVNRAHFHHWDKPGQVDS